MHLPRQFHRQRHRTLFIALRYFLEQNEIMLVWEQRNHCMYPIQFSGPFAQHLKRVHGRFHVGPETSLLHLPTLFELFFVVISFGLQRRLEFGVSSLKFQYLSLECRYCLFKIRISFRMLLASSMSINWLRTRIPSGLECLGKSVQLARRQDCGVWKSSL